MFFISTLWGVQFPEAALLYSLFLSDLLTADRLKIHPLPVIVILVALILSLALAWTCTNTPHRHHRVVVLRSTTPPLDGDSFLSFYRCMNFPHGKTFATIEMADFALTWNTSTWFAVHTNNFTSPVSGWVVKYVQFAIAIIMNTYYFPHRWY